MITLRPMTAGEFSAYSAYFIPDYATDLAVQRGLGPDQALAAAAQDLRESLPQGPTTPGQSLLCILDDAGGLLGYLWYEVQTWGSEAFLMDFHILPPHQGHGLAGLALAAWEAHLAGSGISGLRLRVAPTNARALRVYQRAGFQVTGLTMAKPLAAPTSHESTADVSA